jgi:hypothetical protein
MTVSVAVRAQLRMWTETVERFVLEVITKDRQDKKAAVIRGILFLLSKVFYAAVKLRRFYRAH